MPREESLWPVDQRIFLQTLFGNREPITEADFSQRELDNLRASVEKNQARTGSKARGNVGYADYPQGEEIQPGYAPIESTLGRFNYRATPGQLRATDRYDFWNDERAPNVQRYERMSPVERNIRAPLSALGYMMMLKPRSAAGELGDAFIGREGRTVDIKMPLNKAKGGSVDLTKAENQRDPYAAQRGGPNELTKQYPAVSGFLQSLLGAAPDEMGSVLDPLTARRRAGAEYGFPVGVAAQLTPGLGPLSKLAASGARAGARNLAVPSQLSRQAGVIKMPGGNWLSGSVEGALVQKLGLESPLSIKQIKGKANRAPNEEYLPFVQDFVKSGQWSDVGDLENARLVDIKRYPKRQEALGSRYVTDDELNRYLNQFGDDSRPNMEPGFAAGGIVASPDSGYNPARVDEILSQLRAELQ